MDTTFSHQLPSPRRCPSNAAVLVITNVVVLGTPGTNFTVSIFSLDNSNCASVLRPMHVYVSSLMPRLQSTSVWSGRIRPQPECRDLLRYRGDQRSGSARWRWPMERSGGDDGCDTDQQCNSGPIFRAVTSFNVDASSPLFTELLGLLIGWSPIYPVVFIHECIGYQRRRSSRSLWIPYWTSPPGNNGNLTSCYDVAVPLSVTVPAGYTRGLV